MLATELVEDKPYVILAGSTPVAVALPRETWTTPIVFVTVSDPFGDGFHGRDWFIRARPQVTAYSQTCDRRPKITREHVKKGGEQECTRRTYWAGGRLTANHRPLSFLWGRCPMMDAWNRAQDCRNIAKKCCRLATFNLLNQNEKPLFADRRSIRPDR